jgi:hypothetical protein
MAACRSRRCVSDCRSAPPIDYWSRADCWKRGACVVGVIRNGSAAAPAWASSSRASTENGRGPNRRGVGRIVPRKRCACVDTNNRQHDDAAAETGCASAYELEPFDGSPAFRADHLSLPGSSSLPLRLPCAHTTLKACERRAPDQWSYPTRFRTSPDSDSEAV